MPVENVKYRVQLPPDAHWSEWRPITEKIKEPLILSLKYDREVTWEESNKIMKEIM